MNARLLNVLHDRAHHNLLPVTDHIDINLDRRTEKVIEQYRTLIGHLDGVVHIALQLGFVIDNFHRPTAQYIGRSDNQRIINICCLFQSLFNRANRAVWWLFQIEFFNELLKALAIFGAIDCIWAGTDYRHTRVFELLDQIERCLPAELDDHPDRPFQLDHFDDILKGKRFKIQAVRNIEVSRNRLRITVQHDGFKAIFAHSQSRLHTAIIELDTLPDPVGATSQHHDFVAIAWQGLTLFFIGGIHVGCSRHELSRAGVDALVHRADS